MASVLVLDGDVIDLRARVRWAAVIVGRASMIGLRRRDLVTDR